MDLDCPGIPDLQEFFGPPGGGARGLGFQVLHRIALHRRFLQGRAPTLQMGALLDTFFVGADIEDSNSASHRLRSLLRCQLSQVAFTREEFLEEPQGRTFADAVYNPEGPFGRVRIGNRAWRNPRSITTGPL